MQHSEVPNVLDTKRESVYDEDNKLRVLKQGDKVIYGIIRFFMNKDTRECYPSIKIIKDYANCGYNKINEAISRLISAELITVTKKKTLNGRISNVYYFPKNVDWELHFERFTEAFLKLDMPINVKEYYMDVQQYIIEISDGKGKILYNNSTLSNLTGLSIATIKKYNTWLIQHGFLTESKTSMRDEAGLQVVAKTFNLEQLNQIALWATAITKQVSDNTEGLEELRAELKTANAEIKELKAWKNQREKEDALKRNHVESQIEVSF